MKICENLYMVDLHFGGPITSCVKDSQGESFSMIPTDDDYCHQSKEGDSLFTNHNDILSENGVMMHSFMTVH